MSSALLIAAVSLAAAVKVATPVAPAPASPHPRVSIAAIPAWVDVIALDLEATGPTSAEGGHFTELSDHQTHVDPGDHQVVRFHREVERVVTASGIDAAARVELMFDPEYQRLELVHLQVVRGKQAIDVLRLGELKVLQRESDLERQIYDGRLSVVAVSPNRKAPTAQRSFPGFAFANATTSPIDLNGLLVFTANGACVTMYRPR